jgi:hypothetical protein
MSRFAHTEELEFVVPADQYTSMQDFSAFLYRMKSLYTYTFEESDLFEQERERSSSRCVHEPRRYRQVRSSVCRRIRV